MTIICSAASILLTHMVLPGMLAAENHGFESASPWQTLHFSDSQSFEMCTTLQFLHSIWVRLDGGTLLDVLGIA